MQTTITNIAFTEKNITIKKAIKGSKTSFKEVVTEYESYLYKTAFLYVKKRTGCN
ncbi:MAG: hypothetical protein PUE01_02495 [Clostridiaceae bacterium]|nr:hypothetical protein [Clostridiaceae bacterium]